MAHKKRRSLSVLRKSLVFFQQGIVQLGGSPGQILLCDYRFESCRDIVSAKGIQQAMELIGA